MTQLRGEALCHFVPSPSTSPTAKSTPSLHSTAVAAPSSCAQLQQQEEQHRTATSNQQQLIPSRHCHKIKQCRHSSTDLMLIAVRIWGASLLGTAMSTDGFVWWGIAPKSPFYQGKWWWISWFAFGLSNFQTPRCSQLTFPTWLNSAWI